MSSTQLWISRTKEIQDPSEDGDPGRHEKVSYCRWIGKQEGLHKERNKDVLFLVPKIIKNRLHEVTSYPEDSTLEIYVTY